MSSAIVSPVPSLASLNLRSLGAKFFLLVVLALLMSLGGLFVETLTIDRAQAQGVLAASTDGASAPQPSTLLGIRLASSYRSTRRSLHYITLFLGLVFLTFFLLEVLAAKRLHPAQYALVGVAQLIFYLLLLSLAEHLGFDLAFLLAGAATIGLFSFNTEWLFHSRPLTRRALSAFTFLYAFVYILLRVEAYALLVGALTSFLAVAAAMYLTRGIDWYATTSPLPASPVATPNPPQRVSWLE